MIRSIAYLTDFSDASELPFAHALRLALIFRCHLYLLHVRTPNDAEQWSLFPAVRTTLARWRLLDENAAHSEVEAKLGVKVAKVEVRSEDTGAGAVRFIRDHKPDIIVLATRGREGFKRLLHGSRAEQIARDTHLPALFFGPQARGFVDQGTGLISLKKILVPVTHQPSPRRALQNLLKITASIDPMPTMEFCHIGKSTANLTLDKNIKVEIVSGEIVAETIVSLAKEQGVDLIAMPTAGHDGFVDLLRGSTTERVLRQAHCPVLAIPADA